MSNPLLRFTFPGQNQLDSVKLRKNRFASRWLEWPGGNSFFLRFQRGRRNQHGVQWPAKTGFYRQLKCASMVYKEPILDLSLWKASWNLKKHLGFLGKVPMKHSNMNPGSGSPFFFGWNEREDSIFSERKNGSIMVLLQKKCHYNFTPITGFSN